jgi:hypothetical protein
MKGLVALVVFTLCALGNPLGAIRLTVVSTPEQVALKGVVWLRCDLHDDELALFHKGFAVYADSPHVHIVSWRIDALPTLLPPQIFNRVRRAYLDTVYISVVVQFELHGQALEDALAETNFYVAGLILKRSHRLQQRICPVLAMHSMQHLPQAPLADLFNDTSLTAEVALKPAVLWKRVNPLNESFTWLDACSHVWQQLMLLGRLFNNVYMLFIFFVLLLLCFIKRYTPFPWSLLPVRGLALELLYAASLFGFSILFLCQAAELLGGPWAYFLLAAVLMLGEGYAFFSQPTEKLLLGRLTIIVGWLMGISVLPCLIKGILIWYGW